MLKITSIVPVITNQALMVFRNVKNQALERTPGKDIFIKSVKSPYISEQRIKELYDEIYDEVMAQNIENNPILKDVTINKPEIRFGSVYDGVGIAGYSPFDNTIIVDTDWVNQKRCAIAGYNKNGELCDYWLNLQAQVKFAIKDMKKRNQSVKVIKLNQDEQEIYLKGTLAHELRHCIQSHLVLSCEDGGYRDIKERLRNEIASRNRSIESRTAPKNTPKINMDEFDNLYWNTYKPKKILPKDTKFKISLAKDDNRFWFIYDDFVNSISSRTTDSIYNNDKYIADIGEQDAHRYQFEYCVSKAHEWAKTTNAGKEFLFCYINAISDYFEA